MQLICGQAATLQDKEGSAWTGLKCGRTNGRRSNMKESDDVLSTSIPGEYPIPDATTYLLLGLPHRTLHYHLSVV